MIGRMLRKRLSNYQNSQKINATCLIVIKIKCVPLNYILQPLFTLNLEIACFKYCAHFWEVTFFNACVFLQIIYRIPKKNIEVSSVPMIRRMLRKRLSIYQNSQKINANCCNQIKIKYFPLNYILRPIFTLNLEIACFKYCSHFWQVTFFSACTFWQIIYRVPRKML